MTTTPPDTAPAGDTDLETLVQWDAFPRYLVLDVPARRAPWVEYRVADPPPPHLLGFGAAPRAYKTIRNARRAAGPGGLVLVLDLLCLPVVTADVDTEGCKLTELEFAERQMLLWGERAAKLQATAGERLGLTLEASKERAEYRRMRRENRRRQRELAQAATALTASTNGETP